MEERRLRARLKELGRQMTTNDDAGTIPLTDRINELTDKWLKKLNEGQQHEEVRRTIARVEQDTPDNPVTPKWREELRRQAAAITARSADAEKKGNMVDALGLIETAIQVCPDSPVAKPAIEAFYKRYGVLRVGVESLSRFQTGFAGWTSADHRCADLIHLPIVRADRTDKGTSFGSEVYARLDRSPNNKESEIIIRDGLVWPQDDRPVTVGDLQRLMGDAINDTSPFYHPIFARLVLGVEPRPPAGLQLAWERPQYQPERWLQIPMIRQSRKLADEDVEAICRSVLGPFQWGRGTFTQTVFVANPVFVRKDKPNIKLLTETQQTSSAVRLRQLGKGQIDISAFVPPRHLPAATAMPGVKVMRMRRPTVHVIQFNFNRVELKNPIVRGTIEMAIDREAVLAKLGIPIDGKNTALIDTPLPLGLMGDIKIDRRKADSLMARIRYYSIAKTYKSMAPLRLWHSGTETTRAACEEIARQLNAAGFRTELIDPDLGGSADPFTADLRYQAFSVSDTVYDLVTLLTRDNPSFQRNAEPYIRSRLLSLIDVPTQDAALALLPELGRVLHENYAILPLWQWHDHFAVSERVSGMMKGEPATLYEGIPDWEVKPAMPELYWTPKD
jgi:ABC-type transport system substrate-binding protein